MFFLSVPPKRQKRTGSAAAMLPHFSGLWCEEPLTLVKWIYIGGELFVSPVYIWIVLFVAKYTVMQWKLKVNFYFTRILLGGDTDRFSINSYMWSVILQDVTCG